MPCRLTVLAILLSLGTSATLLAQGYTGELHLAVVDPHGSPIFASLAVVSESEHVDRNLSTDHDGRADLKVLPFGFYRITARNGSLLVDSEVLEIRSALPLVRRLQLAIVPQSTSVQVNADGTLVVPSRTSSSMQIGSQEIADRLSSLPGRSVQDLVLTQPGWLYEGNAVLHPRGSEYQTPRRVGPHGFCRRTSS